jgi:dihydroorotate dehydrogenase (fumarate)
VDTALRLQDAGAAAVVMRSLFEEQIDPPLRRPFAIKQAPDNAARFPEFADYQLSPTQYLRQLEFLKQTLSIPVIASLNGHQPGGWIDYGTRLERAGADAIELNFYRVVTDPAVPADEVETAMLHAVGDLAASVHIPVSVKLSPYHSAVAQLAVALELAGANGVVLFNRFYQPDVDIDGVKVETHLRLSDPGELLLRLRWLAILSPLLRGSIAATGGIHSSIDAVKALLTGADALQLVSVILKHGAGVLGTLRIGLESWMREHGYDDVDQFRGLLDLRRSNDPESFERANYVRALQTWKV